MGLIYTHTRNPGKSFNRIKSLTSLCLEWCLVASRVYEEFPMQIPTIVLIANNLVRNARRSIKKARHIQVTLRNLAHVAFGHMGK
jgi:hypothetical protein